MSGPGKRGPDSTYTKEMGDNICDRISDGVSLSSICREPGMPNKVTVFRWIRQFPEFQAQYIIAKEESADAMFEDTLAITDEAPRMTIGKNGNEVVDTGWEMYRRTRIDTRKWASGKMKPKKYGEKLALGGADDLPPMQIQGRIVLVKPSEDGK
jgi:hypothetical protein